MKPEWCPQDIWAAAQVSSGNYAVTDHALICAIARALLDAHQRGKDENQAEIDRLNKVVARMQKTMSSQAEQWSRSMAEAQRGGMEEAAMVARCAFDDRPRRDSMDWNDGFDDGTKAAEYAIRAKAQEVKT